MKSMETGRQDGGSDKNHAPFSVGKTGNISRKFLTIILKIFDKNFERLQEQIEVLLIDYRMAGNFGFNGTTLINYINDHVRDLECFILTGVDRELISDGLVTDRNTFQKTIFNTEADDPQKVQELLEFIDVLRNSAKVYRVRREQKIERYKELLELKKSGKLGADEEEFLSLYKVLSSYGMVENLPQKMLSSSFEKDLDDLLRVGEAIVKKYTEE